MFKTIDDLGTTSGELTKDAEKEQTISPLPPVPMFEITSLPQQRMLVRPREPEILGTSPLFVSQGSKGVGSIYYPEGRIRLFHPMGPTVEEYIPYRLSISKPEIYSEIKIWIKNFCSDHQFLPKLSDFQQYFRNYYTQKIFQDVGSLLEPQQVMIGKLYELHLDKEGTIVGIHPSEGRVTPYTSIGVNLDTDLLYYVIKYIEEIVVIIISSFANRIDYITANKEIYYFLGSLLPRNNEEDKEDMAMRSVETALRDIFIPQNIIKAYQYALKFSGVDEFISYITAFKKKNQKQLLKNDYCLMSATTSKDIEKLYEKLITPYQDSWLISMAQDISKDFNQDIHEFVGHKIFDIWLKDSSSPLYHYMKGYLANLLLEQTQVIDQTKLHTRKK